MVENVAESDQFTRTFRKAAIMAMVGVYLSSLIEGGL